MYPSSADSTLRSPHRANALRTSLSAFRQQLRGPHLPLLLLTVIAVVPRLVLLIAGSTLIWPDSVGYYESAVAMVQHHSIASVEIFHSPFYPLFLSFFFALGSGPAVAFAILAAQHLLGLGVVLLFYDVARRVASPAVAFCAAALLSVHSVLLYYECVIQSEILFEFLVVLYLFLSLRALEQRSLINAVLAGAICGLAALTRPVGQALFLCLIPLILWQIRDRRRCLAMVAAVLLAFAGVVAPFLVANHRMHGYWGLTHGQGLNLTFRVFDVDGMRPRSDTKYPQMKRLYEKLIRGNHQTWYRFNQRLLGEQHLSPLAADQLMFSFAVETLKAHPVRFLLGTLIGAEEYFWDAKNSVRKCPPREGTFSCVNEDRFLPHFPYSELTRSPLDRFLREAFSLPSLLQPGVLCLSGFGVLCSIWMALLGREPLRLGTVLLLMTALYFALLTALFTIFWDRFRLPVDPTLFLFAAVGAERVWAFIRAYFSRHAPDVPSGVPLEVRRAVNA